MGRIFKKTPLSHFQSCEHDSDRASSWSSNDKFVIIRDGNKQWRSSQEHQRLYRPVGVAKLPVLPKKPQKMQSNCSHCKFFITWAMIAYK